MTMPSADRPPPPVVAPVTFEGLRYEQDSGHGNGGWLVARDAQTGEKRWELEVFHVPDPSPDAPSLGATGYFGSMRLMPEQRRLRITAEYSGAPYLVDLDRREVVERPTPPAAPEAPPMRPKPRPE